MLRTQIAACRICADMLPCGPRPIVQFGDSARILIVSQAPGRTVHDTGTAWNDASGARLRDWTGLARGTLHDARTVALLPMGFCYPGRGSGGDLPPRRECAPLWHDRILARLTGLRLTLLIGHFAQHRYLPHARRLAMTGRVAAFDAIGPNIVCLPHPSWRAAGWMQRNPWFVQDIVPRLRRRVAEAITSEGKPMPCPL